MYRSWRNFLSRSMLVSGFVLGSLVSGSISFAPILSMSVKFLILALIVVVIVGLYIGLTIKDVKSEDRLPHDQTQHTIVTMLKSWRQGWIDWETGNSLRHPEGVYSITYRILCIVEGTDKWDPRVGG